MKTFRKRPSRGILAPESNLTLCALLVSALSLCLQSMPVSAAPMPKMVPGDEALARVNKLMTGITWYTSLANAEQIAQKQNKPVFWVHMLGPINGMT